LREEVEAKGHAGAATGGDANNRTKVDVAGSNPVARSIWRGFTKLVTWL